MQFVIVITVLFYSISGIMVATMEWNGVLAKSKIAEMIEAREFDIPAPSTYMTCDFDPLPYFLVGDEILPLKTWVMRSYPGKLIKNNEFSIIVYPGLVELLRMLLEYSVRAGECFTLQ